MVATNAGVTYSYDGDGKRVAKSNGKLYWYPSAGLRASGMSSLDALVETDAAGNNPTEYIFFPSAGLGTSSGRRIARRDPDGSVFYYFADHLGSSRVVTNATGVVVQESDYYPFGGERAIVNNDPNPYKFTSKERDTESGLDNFGARYFASTLGRFQSPDPINLTRRRLVNPANTLNKYAYAANNPLHYTDPDGKDIVVFYRRSSFGNLKDWGHIFIAAINQKTGKVKFLDFYPDGRRSVINRNMTGDRLRMHAAITIRTTPEEAQKVIDFIEKLENNTPDYDAFTNNCTTICQEAMALIGIPVPGDIFPDDLWKALYAQYSDEALSAREQLHNPFFAPLFPRYQAGVDFGRTSFLPRDSSFSVFDLLSLIIRAQAAEQSEPRAKRKRKACVTIPGPKGPDTACEEY